MTSVNMAEENTRNQSQNGPSVMHHYLHPPSEGDDSHTDYPPYAYEQIGHEVNGYVQVQVPLHDHLYQSLKGTVGGSSPAPLPARHHFPLLAQQPDKPAQHHALHDYCCCAAPLWAWVAVVICIVLALTLVGGGVYFGTDVFKAQTNQSTTSSKTTSTPPTTSTTTPTSTSTPTTPTTTATLPTATPTTPTSTARPTTPTTTRPTPSTTRPTPSTTRPTTSTTPPTSTPPTSTTRPPTSTTRPTTPKTTTTTTPTTTTRNTTRAPVFADCQAAYEAGERVSGPVEVLLLGSSSSCFVWCDMQEDGGGWTVIQRRTNGSVNFNRNWMQYANGFGDVHGEYWAGTNFISLLTKGRNQQLLVKVKRYTTQGTAKYGLFEVADSSDNYRLTVARFLGGSAGDSLLSSDPYESNDQKPFSTPDRNNVTLLDPTGSSSPPAPCVAYLQAGWWFAGRGDSASCGRSNLNGQLGQTGRQGAWWYTLRDDFTTLTETTMMVRGDRTDST